jgi:hypothetical protein
VFSIYGAKFGPLFGLALVINLVSALIVLLLIGAGAGLGGLLVGNVVAILLSTLYAGMVVSLVQDLQDGRQDHTVGELARSATPVLLPLIGMSVVYAIGVAVGLLALLVPGLVLLTIWAVAAPVIVVERLGVVDSLGRSRELVRGNGWQVFGAVVTALLLSLFVTSIAGEVSTGSDAGFFFANWILPALVAPVTALVSAVLYFALVPAAEPTWEAPQPSM